MAGEAVPHGARGRSARRADPGDASRRTPATRRRAAPRRLWALAPQSGGPAASLRVARLPRGTAPGLPAGTLVGVGARRPVERHGGRRRHRATDGRRPEALPGEALGEPPGAHGSRPGRPDRRAEGKVVGDDEGPVRARRGELPEHRVRAPAPGVANLHAARHASAGGAGGGRPVEDDDDRHPRRDECPEPAREGDRGKRPTPAPQGVEEVRPVDEEMGRAAERVGGSAGHARDGTAGCPDGPATAVRRCGLRHDPRHGPRHVPAGARAAERLRLPAGLPSPRPRGRPGGSPATMPAMLLLVDLDGVVYRGAAPIPGVAAVLAARAGGGDRVVYVTNNSMHDRADYVARLGALGAPVTADRVVSSARAAALYLADPALEPPVRRVLALGAGGLERECRDAGLEVVTAAHAATRLAHEGLDGWDAGGRPDAVVVGLDPQLTYERLAVAVDCVRHGARFVATNRDPLFPTERGTRPGAGSIVAAVEAAAQVTPVSIGKPGPLLLEMAIRAAGDGLGRADAVMVGDGLATDLAAAHGLGIPCVLMLTGVTTREQVDALPDTDRPAALAADAAELAAALELLAARPRD